MSDELPQEIPKETTKEKRGRFSLLMKILFCISALILVVFTVLANMGGNSEFHRQSIEQFALESTGFRGRVRTLHNMTYFPTFSVDLEDMELLAGPDGELDVPVVRIEAVRLALTFREVIFRTGRMRVFNLQGIEIAPGILFEKPVQLRHIAISDTGEGIAIFGGQGHIGAAPLEFSMDMSARGSGRQRIYNFEPTRAATLKIGDINVSAVLQNGINPFLAAQDIKITRAGNIVASGHINTSRRRSTEIVITGEMTLTAHGTILRPDIVIDAAARRISGVIATENFNEADFKAGSEFDALLRGLVAILGDETKHSNVLDAFFEAHEIMLESPAYSGKIKFKNNTLNLR